MVGNCFQRLGDSGQVSFPSMDVAPLQADKSTRSSSTGAERSRFFRHGGRLRFNNCCSGLRERPGTAFQLSGTFSF